MFIKFIKTAATLSTLLALTACGGLDQEAAPQLLASAAPAAFDASSEGLAAAEGSGEAFRVVAWEQSISLEMNRRHEEQQSRVQEAGTDPHAGAAAGL